MRAIKAAAKAPRMPPPSRLRIRNIVLLQFGLMRDAAPLPRAGCKPDFIIIKPQRQPGHDRCGYGHIRPPLSSLWIEKAGAVRRIRMRYRPTVLACVKSVDVYRRSLSRDIYDTDPVGAARGRGLQAS